MTYRVEWQTIPIGFYIYLWPRYTVSQSHSPKRVSIVRYLGGGQVFNVTYYFDILALHSEPEHFESLTSYLILLVEIIGNQGLASRKIEGKNCIVMEKLIVRGSATRKKAGIW